MKPLSTSLVGMYSWVETFILGQLDLDDEDNKELDIQLFGEYVSVSMSVRTFVGVMWCENE